MGTLRTILKDNWEWRDQIGGLALFELRKKSRGAALGWAWFFVRPAIYIFCFWFALSVGLRQGSDVGGPYLLWLAAGLMPWFFMQEVLNTGSNVLHRYPYLVKKIRFPLSAISSIFVSATMIIHLVLVVVLFVMYFLLGQPLDIHLVQVPLLIVLLFVFWDMFSIFTSQLTGVSKDVANLIKALTTPLFWLSGIIFDVSKIQIDWLQGILDFNPVTFFAGAYRDAFINHTWFWEDTGTLIGFAIVFALTLIMMVWVYRHFNEEVADVL